MTQLTPPASTLHTRARTRLVAQALRPQPAPAPAPSEPAAPSPAASAPATPASQAGFGGLALVLNEPEPEAAEAQSLPAVTMPPTVPKPTPRVWTLTLDGQGRIGVRSALRHTAFEGGGRYWATADPQARVVVVHPPSWALQCPPGLVTMQVRIDARGRLALGALGRAIGLGPGDICGLGINPDTGALTIALAPTPKEFC